MSQDHEFTLGTVRIYAYSTERAEPFRAYFSTHLYWREYFFSILVPWLDSETFYVLQRCVFEDCVECSEIPKDWDDLEIQVPKFVREAYGKTDLDKWFTELLEREEKSHGEFLENTHPAYSAITDRSAFHELLMASSLGDKLTVENLASLVSTEDRHVSDEDKRETDKARLFLETLHEYPLLDKLWADAMLLS